MKNRLLIILFGLLFCIPNVNAQNDNLEPVESIFDDYDFQFEYYSLIRKVLMNGMSDYPEVRFLIIPSFSVEEVVAIEKENEKYFIVHHKMSKSIWYTDKNKEKIKVKKKKVEISESDMKLYKELFKKAITHRKYPDKEIMGLDGVNYYFSVADRPLKTGTVWSPKSGSKMDRLKEVGYSLISLANDTKEDEKVELKTELIERIKKLTTEIK
ncbi:hypothetical protein [Aequorivita marisscotiae]|uniref:DUF4136 domain-containing protein n=1 Tax=Aequorivita marisscotiae TaxID=3040348 RepID=A0ABY8KX81_9FLAO|nr:hypothetical protein [Aequorivita sp. Ant34-E75]WGF93989.1 hypothetical protein QCQ61_07305 [Aequorivita sp. Ant34-E75]